MNDPIMNHLLDGMKAERDAALALVAKLRGQVKYWRSIGVQQRKEIEWLTQARQETTR